MIRHIICQKLFTCLGCKKEGPKMYNSLYIRLKIKRSLSIGIRVNLFFIVQSQKCKSFEYLHVLVNNLPKNKTKAIILFPLN